MSAPQTINPPSQQRTCHELGVCQASGPLCEGLCHREAQRRAQAALVHRIASAQRDLRRLQRQRALRLMWRGLRERAARVVGPSNLGVLVGALVFFSAIGGIVTLSLACHVFGCGR